MVGESGFKVEVPITLKGGNEGKKVGKDIGGSIAEQIKKSLGSIGIGKGKGESGGAGLIGGVSGKMVGWLAVIGLVVEGLSFILKPILSLFKVILMLLFMPLVPLLKPTMQALAAFVKWFAPLMKKAVILTEKIYKGILNFIVALVSGVTGIFKGIFEALGAGWDMIKNAGAWIWDNILMPGFSVILNFGMWIWEKFVLGLKTISDLGKKIWEFIKGLFVGTINVGSAVWNWFKGLFVGTINVATTVWNWFKGLFVGTINVATTVWNWFKGLFGGRGSSRSVGDAIITPQGVVHTNPQDYIIATKNPASLGGGKITININNPSVRNDMDVRKIANQVSQVLQRQMTGRVS